MRTVLAFLLASLVWAGEAHALLIDFNEFAHGEIVPNALLVDGVQIHLEVENLVQRPSHPDLGVGFDTTLAGTRAPDLEDPWKVGNLAPFTNLRTALIVQGNRNGCFDGTGFCEKPVDERDGRPTGRITATLENSVFNQLGIDLIDVDNLTTENGSVRLVNTFLDTFREVSFADMFTDPDLCDPMLGPCVFGDNSANRFVVDFLDDDANLVFDQVQIVLAGSGAVDNFHFSLTAPVPEPGAPLLFAAGLLVASSRLRRRSRR